MSAFIVKKDNISPCCNLILWDLFVTWIFTSGLASSYLPNLSTFQHFIIGLVGVFILMVLMIIPYIGPVIQVLFSVLWTAVAYYLIDQFFHISEYSILWRCGIGLICFIIVMAIHFGSAEDMNIFSFTRSSPLSDIPHHNSPARGVSNESSSAKGAFYKRTLSENKLNQSGTLTNIIGLYDSIDTGRIGIFSDSYFVASTNSNIIISVVKSLAVTSDRPPIQDYTLMLFDKNGNILKELDNKNVFNDFEQQVKNIEKDYGFINCRKFSDSKQAYEYVRSSLSRNISSMQKSIQEKINVCESHYKLAISLSDTVSSLSNTPDGIRLKGYVKQNASDIVRKHNYLIHNVSHHSKTSDISMLQQLSSILDDCILNFDAYIKVLQDMLEKYEKNYASYHNSQSSPSQDVPKNAANSTYFKGCDTLDKLNKRYRDLVKIYHSDSGNGNDEIFVQVTEEYNILKENIMH